MAPDLCWVADELARLHQDLQEIRARQAAEAAQGEGDGKTTPTQQDHTEPDKAATHDGQS